MTNTNNPNQGIQVSGGSFNADNVAAGPRAQAHKTSYGDTWSELEKRQEIQKKLAELEKALDAHASSLQNAEEIRSSTTVIADELRKKQPNKLTVSAILNGIADSVKSITGIALAVEALKNAVTTLI